MARDPRQCSGGFFNMGRHSGFCCWGRGATIQVWKWERFDCLSGGRMRSRGARGERQVSFNEIHLHQVLLYSVSDLCASASAECISLTFYQLSEKRGEVVWNTSAGWSGANRKESRVFYLVSCEFFWSQRWLNGCPPNFSSSCCLPVTAVVTYVK